MPAAKKSRGLTTGEWESDFHERSKKLIQLDTIIEPPPPKVENESLHAEKWQAAAAKANATWKMANTLAKALAKRASKRWQFIDFLGPAGREAAGIVDILAMRKSGKAPDHPILKRYDLFEVYIIQVKGGSAKMPTMEEVVRLIEVKKIYGATGVVLFQWQDKVKSGFYLLDQEKFTWEQKSAASLFGM